MLAPTISWICKWLPIEELFLPGTGSIPWNRQRELRQKMFCLRKKSFFSWTWNYDKSTNFSPNADSFTWNYDESTNFVPNFDSFSWNYDELIQVRSKVQTTLLRTWIRLLEIMRNFGQNLERLQVWIPFKRKGQLELRHNMFCWRKS